MKHIYIVLSALVLLWSCDQDFDPNVDDAVVQSGNADFSTYVALGNSLTAGYLDGALYISGQENSYPAIMAEQMMMAGGGAFTQPLMPDEIGGFSDLNVAGKLTLQQNAAGSLVPVPTAASSALSLVNGSYNNMGVPGAKSFHLVAPGYAALNPYFGRMATAPTNTVLQDAMAVNATFFSLWIGNNDVLGYATAGGDANVDVITSTALFEQAYTGLVQGMVANGAKGVVANLPYVTSIPFFNYIPYNPLTPDLLGGEAAVNTINTSFHGPLTQVLSALGAGDRISLLSTTEANPVLIEDETLTDLSAQITAVAAASGDPTLMALAPILGAQFGQARMAAEGDLVCLTTASVLGQVDATRVGELMALGLDQATAGQFSVNGVTYPLRDVHMLTSSEVAECTVATDSFNNIIANIANTYDLAYFDASSKMEELSSNSGLNYDGVTYDATFVTGGSFSLDGVHPNSRGYSIIANGFIEAINSKFGSSLPIVSPNNYPGITFPN